MWCCMCNNELHECVCPDLEERLAKIGKLKNVASQYDKKCNQHYALCRCPDPEWEIRVGGEVLNAEHD